ncbi:MAG: bifunctional enzyme CysN/CysC [Chloroflexota bacterium]|jgi:bifunctional enzyme CysN/CysC|nr:bifunctional enzyme CysN/CysC [Chloroflexota bacterium]
MVATDRAATQRTSSEALQIVIVGHVDHGKSTLLGRLYADTGSLPDGKLEKVQAICRQQGKEFEYAFLFDAFLEEQEQGITIDTARTFFAWQGRQYIVIDAPGHKEFLKNMVSGAARAEAALLLIDAAEGVQEQSRKHGYLLSLLGVRQVAVVVNKMDLVGYDQGVYDAIEREYRDYLTQLGVEPERFIPVSARNGDNVAVRSTQMPWYTGATVLEALGAFHKATERTQLPLRLPVQDVYKFDARRIIAGRITAGRLRVGDRLVFAPSNKSAVVRTIERFNVDPLPTEAVAGESIGVTLDEQIFVERGEVASIESSPSAVATEFRANLFWMGKQPLETGKRYALRLATREVACEVETIHRVVDTADLDAQQTRSTVQRNEVAELTIRTRAPIAVDLSHDFEVTGRFVLIDEYDVAGGGIVTEIVRDAHAVLREEARRRDLSWVKGDVSPDDRAAYYGHRAALVLVTGDAADVKYALVRELERRLVADGRHAYLLDAANLQRGLDADLQQADTGELARRFGEVARLLLDTGSIVVSTTNALAGFDPEAIETLVHPNPAIVVRVGEAEDRMRADDQTIDLTFAATVDADAAADQVMAAMKERDLLAAAIGTRQSFQYANYTI